MLNSGQILLPSLRNTIDAQLSLFEKVGSKVLITCPSLAQQLKPLHSAPAKFKSIQAPTLNELLSEKLVPHYSYEKTFEEVSVKPMLFLHTSGSSGMLPSLFEKRLLIAKIRKPKTDQLEHEVHKRP